MAEKIEISQEYMTLGRRFLDDMFDVIKDFIEIDETKHNKIMEIRKNKDNALSDLEAFTNFTDFRENISKRKSFSYAMFTFLYSTYEKHVNELIKFSYLNNKEVQINLEKKVWEYNREIEPLLDSHYSQLSKPKQREYLLKFIRKVLDHKTIGLPPLAREHYLFNIPDEIMWASKYLKLEYKEIVARRNLLTHRKNYFDQDYIDQATSFGGKKITKSKKVSDPNDLFIRWAEMGYFGMSENSKKLKCFQDLLKKEISVPIYFNYFLESASILISIYSKMINQASPSIDYTIHCLFRWNKLYAGTLVSPFIPLHAIRSSQFFQEKYMDNFDKENFKQDIEYMKGNTLLAYSDLLKCMKKYKITDIPLYKDFFKEKQALIDFFKTKKDKILIKEDMVDWPLFKDVFKISEFKELFNKKLKSKKTIPVYQMLVAIAEGKEQECISFLR